MREWLRRTMYCICCLATMGLVACNASHTPPTIQRQQTEGRFVLYLNGPAKTPFDITLELTAMEVRREDGAQFVVLDRPRRLNSLQVVGQQILLGETFLPQGRYTNMLVRVAKAQLSQEGEKIDLAVPPEGFLLEVNFAVRAGEATPLFMTWNVERAIEQEAFLRPAFAFEGKAQVLSGIIAYISNEDSDTVSVLNRITDRVVSVIEVGKGPKGLVVSPDASRVLVLNAASNTLSILDVNTNRVLHTVNLDIGASPSDLVMTPDGRTLYVANTGLNTVSVMNAVSFQTRQTIPVGQRPVALTLTPRGNRLLVANSMSNTISVIDTFRNQVTATISVEFQPTDVAVDLLGAQAFVTHQGSPRLSIISLSTLRVTKTVAAGIAAAVLPDAATSRVFIARSRLHRVRLFDTNLNAEIDSVVVGADPQHLAADIERGKLYVVNRGADSVTVIDTASRRVRATIPVGKRPYAIAVVRERSRQ